MKDTGPGSSDTPYANHRQVRPFQTSYRQSSHVGNLDIQPVSSGPNHKNYHPDLKSLRLENGYHLRSLAGGCLLGRIVDSPYDDSLSRLKDF